MAQRRAEGVHVGRPRDLSDEIVTRIVAERATGATLRAIAGGLTEERVPTARGQSVWAVSTVQGVLASITGRSLVDRVPRSA